MYSKFTITPPSPQGKFRYAFYWKHNTYIIYTVDTTNSVDIPSRVRSIVAKRPVLTTSPCRSLPRNKISARIAGWSGVGKTELLSYFYTFREYHALLTISIETGGRHVTFCQNIFLTPILDFLYIYVIFVPLCDIMCQMTPIIF